MNKYLVYLTLSLICLLMAPLLLIWGYWAASQPQTGPIGNGHLTPSFAELVPGLSAAILGLINTPAAIYRYIKHISTRRINMPQLIALDLDGTLLNANKEVSPRNLNAILKCHQSGIRIVLATARPPRSVRTFIPESLLAIASFVYYNGALVVDPRAGIEEHRPIPMAVTARIMDYCRVHSQEAAISVEVKDRWYANRAISDASLYNLKFHPTVLPIDELLKLEATKVLVSLVDDLEQFQEMFREEAKVIVTDNKTLIQVMNMTVSKGFGIALLCQHYGIRPSEVMVFGDDHNDLEMFQMGGQSIAMANAVEELKALANEITASNDEDGVAQVLERLYA